MSKNAGNIEQINIWMDEGNAAVSSRLWDQALDYFEKSAELAESVNLREEHISALRRLASVLEKKLNYSRAMSVLNEALSVARVSNLRFCEAKILTELSNLHLVIHEHESSLELIFKAISIYEDLGELEEVGMAFLRIGEINLQNLNYDQALNYLQKAKKALNFVENEELQTSIYRLLAEAYLKSGDQNKAFYYCLKSIEKAEAYDFHEEKRKNYLLMGDTYKHLGQFRQSLKHYRKAIIEAERLEDDLEKAVILNHTADLYCRCSKFQDAITTLDQAVSTAIIHSDNYLLADIYLNYARAFEGMENYKRAFVSFKKHTHIQNTLQEHKIRLKTEALESKYDFEKAEKQKYLAIESLKLKDQFLANVSHEIKTPMHGILGLTEMLLQDTPRQDQVEQLSSINDSAKRLMSIIEDILYLSKINTGKININDKDFELKRYIEQLMSIVHLVKKDKPINIVYHISPNVPKILNGDPHRLLQILINLLNNAVKFTPEGEVGIEVKLISKVNSKVNLRFTVYDTGIGIEKENLGKIFKAFEQIDSSNSRAYGGTGIGLNIVQQLVNILNGVIRVESSPGEGSRFHVELPYKISDKREIEAYIKTVLEVEKSFESARILVVEDNKINQLYIERIFRKWNDISYKIAGNGQEAIHILEQEEFDLILMDLQMPGMNGFETTHYIRNKMLSDVSNTPIVAITANDSPLIEEKVEEAGMNGYLFKPFDEHELFHIMRLNLKSKFKETSIAKSINNSLKNIPDAPSDLLKDLSRKVDGNKRYMAEFLQIFLDQYPEAITLMHHHINERDWVQVQRVAHRIKSTINIIGLKDLYDVIKAIDKHTRGKTNFPTVQPLYEQFVEIGNLRVLQLEKELQKLKSDIKKS